MQHIYNNNFRSIIDISISNQINTLSSFYVTAKSKEFRYNFFRVNAFLGKNKVIESE